MSCAAALWPFASALLQTSEPSLTAPFRYSGLSCRVPPRRKVVYKPRLTAGASSTRRNLLRFQQPGSEWESKAELQRQNCATSSAWLGLYTLRFFFLFFSFFLVLLVSFFAQCLALVLLAVLPGVRRPQLRFGCILSHIPARSCRIALAPPIPALPSAHPTVSQARGVPSIAFALPYPRIPYNPPPPKPVVANRRHLFVP